MRDQRLEKAWQNGYMRGLVSQPGIPMDIQDKWAAEDIGVHMNDADITLKDDGWEFYFDDYSWDGSWWRLTVKCHRIDAIDFLGGVVPRVARVYSHADTKEELPWRSLPQGFRDQIEEDIAANYRYNPEQER